jgi:60 kDa SS-A/Ro ribonucleoprotein
MAKYNVAPVSLAQSFADRSDATTNHEGGLAFTQDPLTRLYTRLTASFDGEKSFYTDGDASRDSLRADVHAAAAENPEGVLRLAAYARQVMNMRTAPITVLVEAASVPACKPFVRRWTPQIVRRADELAEVVACWVKTHGHIGTRGLTGGEHAFPNSLSRGLEDALTRFNEYHFAKYDRPGSVTLRDVLRIVRPKPGTEERAALFKYLVKGELDTARLPLLTAKAALLKKESFDEEARELAAASHVTWEVLVSKFGSSSDTWNALEFPFMAGMRNIANFMRKDASQALDRVIAMLRDPRRVASSKQLPFRFFAAYRTLSREMSDHPRLSEVLEALVLALECSVANVPRLPGRTFVTSDNSGSMHSALSARSSLEMIEVGSLMAAIAHGLCDDAICSVFGEGHAVVPVVKSDSVMTNMERFKGTDVGHSTNAYLSLRYLREKRLRVDRIVLFSDMQCYDSGGYGGSLASELELYRREVNPEVFMYSVDLAGHGTSQFPQGDSHVALLAGWSERLLELIPRFEADKSQALQQILCWQPSVRAPREEEVVEPSPEPLTFFLPSFSTKLGSSLLHLTR